MTLSWLSKQTPLDYNGTVNVFIDQSNVIAEGVRLQQKTYDKPQWKHTNQCEWRMGKGLFANCQLVWQGK